MSSKDINGIDLVSKPPKRRGPKYEKLWPLALGELSIPLRPQVILHDIILRYFKHKEGRSALVFGFRTQSLINQPMPLFLLINPVRNGQSH